MPKFEEPIYGYCFNAAEPVPFKVRNNGDHLFTLKGSCYEPIEKWPNRNKLENQSQENNNSNTHSGLNNDLELIIEDSELISVLTDDEKEVLRRRVLERKR